MSDIVERLLSGNPGPDSTYPQIMVEAAKTIESLRFEVTQWVNHAKTAIWSDSEECKLLAADNERLRAALRDVYMTTRCIKTANKARAALQETNHDR